MTNTMTAHLTLDRKERLDRIERTIGIGKPVAIASDRKHQDCFNILTDTGVMIIQTYDKTIVTLWVARLSQAIDVYKRTTGSSRLPQKLFETIQRNNTPENKKFFDVAA